MNRERAIGKAKKWMLRKCGTGTECACEKVKKVFASERIEIQAGSVSFLGADGEDDHPNKLPFKGVLLIVDAPSTKPPHGSRGHRIYVPKKVVEEKLDGLIGMGVNYDPEDLNEHKTQNKVGIVTKAWTKGNQVWVSGFIYKKDFPKAADDLKRRGLGMSMELANVYVRDENEDVWHLEDFAFTGATILKKSAAAYFQTELVAKGEKPALTATAAAVSGNRKGATMDKQKKDKVVAAASDTGQGALLVSAIKGAISEAMNPMVQELKASNDRHNELRTDLEELKGLYLIQAAAQEDVEIEAGKDEEEEMDAASKDNQDEEDNEDNADDEGEEGDLDAELEKLEKEAVEEDTGELNKDAKNKGDKTTVTDPPTQGVKVGGGVAKGRLKSSGLKAGKPFPGLKSSASIQAAAVEIASLTAQVGQLKRINRKAIDQLNAQAREYKKDRQKLLNKVESLEAQAEKWATGVTRRSVAVPVEIRNLMAKSSVDVNELQREGKKLSVSDVDRMFAVAKEQGIEVDTTMRAGYKTRMYELGLMESGQQEWGQN